jgi:hypothetical protein
MQIDADRATRDACATQFPRAKLFAQAHAARVESESPIA